MQGPGIKISPVRPGQRMGFRINPNLAELGCITKWTEKMARKSMTCSVSSSKRTRSV